MRGYFHRRIQHDYYRWNHITQQVQDAMWQPIYQQTMRQE